MNRSEGEDDEKFLRTEYLNEEIYYCALSPFNAILS